MLVIWIPLLLISVSVLVLVIIALGKVPYLRALDVLSMPKAKVDELKKSLVAKRLSRAGKKWGEILSIIVAPLARLGKTSVKSMKGTVLKWEERYQKLKNEAIDPKMMNPATVSRMVADAEQLIKEARYGEAEKKLIEILSHDPKNLTVYEDLGALYMQTKNVDQAEETFKFILRAQPNDASVLTSLGEIALQRGKPKEAATYFGKAVKKRTKNPKYLDFLVEASIQAMELDEARRALTRLRSVNPENQKLDEFEQRIVEKEGQVKAEAALVKDVPGQETEKPVH